MAQLNYSANFEDASEGFDIVPAGTYVAVITEADYVPNKQNNGMILKNTYTILDGTQKGKKIFENLNLKNPNAQAQKISQTALNALMKAIGLRQLNDTAELLNKPLSITTKIKKSEEYGDQASIQKHEPYAGNAQSFSTAVTGSQNTAPAAQSQNGATPPPWANPESKLQP